MYTYSYQKQSYCVWAVRVCSYSSYETGCVFYRLRWVIDHREQGKAGYCSAYAHTFIPLLCFSFPSFPSSFVPSPSLPSLRLPSLYQTSLSSSVHHSLITLSSSVPTAITLPFFSFKLLSTLHPSHAIFKRLTHFVFLHSFSVLLSRAQGNEETLSRVFFLHLLLLLFPMLCSCSSTLLLLWQGASLPSEDFLRLFLTTSSIHPLHLHVHPSIHPSTQPSTILQEVLKQWHFEAVFVVVY